MEKICIDLKKIKSRKQIFFQKPGWANTQCGSRQNISLVPKPRVNLARARRFQRVQAPTRNELNELVQRISQRAGRSLERHAAIKWAQRLKRVINIDIETCGRCGGSVKVNDCIEDQNVIDRILTHLCRKEQEQPTLPLLVPRRDIASQSEL